MENAPQTKSQLRLFLGLPVEIHDSLASAIKKTRIGADKREMEIHWVPSANYHITLNFLGPTPSAELPRLKELMQAVACQHPPFSAELKGMGAFPDAHHMRTLWVGVRHTRALAELQMDLREKLVAGGFQQDERAYSPHLTIGKTRKARNATDLLSPFIRTRFGEINCDGILLYESVQYGPHSTYEVLERTALTGPVREPPESGFEA